ncbi:hypothetical protein Leryth_023408 [Lithospermum erythrorhizon]|nr:hypothetical protein Leryth_023408 [Lithospermum erythrorhizon]
MMRVMDSGGQMQKPNSCGDIGLRLLWNILHWVLNIFFIIVSLAQMLQSFLISNASYQTLNIHKLKYLGVAIDSQEAKQTEKVVRLLEWLTAIGVKNVCLYDTEGILKKSKDTITECQDVRNSLSHQNVEVEFTSFHDGKEAVTKAANFLFKKYYLHSNQEKSTLAELHMGEALEATGCGGPEPDLLLIYAPTRIHLGFPAWRIRYTEIVHMGSLNSMKFGLLIKAIHKFTMVRQNYGNNSY